jgi:peptide/nickel transport system permease protein
MGNTEQKHFADSLAILCLIMLPLICLLVRLVPGIGLRCILLAIISCCSLYFFLFGTSIKGRVSKIIGVIFLLPIILSASLTVVLPENIATATEVLSFEKNLLPNGMHILGTDYKGRDILFSLIEGGGNTYFIAIIATLLSSLLGVAIGILMTVEQRLVKIIAKLFVESFETLPWIFFLVIVTGVFFVWINELNYTPPTVFKVLIIGILIGLTSTPYTSRLVQRIVEKDYQSPYILTFKASAVSRLKVLLYNVFWKKVVPHLIVQISFIFGLIILVESSLEYILSIGFGEYGKAGYLSWGRILADARPSAIFGEKLWIIVPPILCITFSILGSNMIGDSLSKNFSRRLKN